VITSFRFSKVLSSNLLKTKTNQTMNTIQDIITFLNENSGGLFSVFTLLVALFSAIAAITPTPKDDGWAAKAYKVVDWLALNVFKAKDK